MSTSANRTVDSNQPWEDYDAILRTAERARTTGGLARAHTFFARLVEIDPNDPRGWVGMASTAQTLDERIISWGYALAVTTGGWEARIQLDASVEERIAQSGIADAPVLIALGRTLAEVGQRPSAHRILGHATELDPTNLEGWLWRGGVSDEPSEVVNCLQRALALEPENAQAKAGLVWALEKQAASRQPISDANANHARQMFDTGQGTFQAGDLPGAHDWFKRATELDPHYAEAWFWRGSTTTQTEEALTCMEQTLKLNPQHRSAKDTAWWLRVKKYRASFPTKPAPPIITPPPTPAETTSPSRLVRRLALVLLGVFLILLTLAIAIWAWSSFA